MADQDPQTPPKKPALGLSLTQLVGGSAAAATAAVLGARLGTTGTIIGAALVSLVSAVASAIYQASIRRTQEVVARTKELLPTTVTWRATRTDDLPEVAEQAVEEGVEESTPSVWSRIRWKSVAVAAGAFFVITALLVTGYEVVSGRSIEGSGRSTVGNAFHGGSSSSTTPTPTPTPSKQPTTSASTTTAATTSPTPSSSPTSSASTTPSASASPTPSASASPSASGSSSPAAVGTAAATATTSSGG